MAQREAGSTGSTRAFRLVGLSALGRFEFGSMDASSALERRNHGHQGGIVGRQIFTHAALESLEHQAAGRASPLGQERA